MLTPVRAILFDCDGVLVDSEVVGLEESAAFLATRGFDWSPSDLIRRFTGMRQDAFAAGLREAYGEVLGRPATDEEHQALVTGIVGTRRAQRHTMTLVPGAAATVATARGLPDTAIAVASSSAQHFLDDKIDRYGLRKYFGRHVYSADSVDQGKPSPDIFLRAAAQVAVAPERCLVIEDSRHGVLAGRAAGAEVWGFLGGGHAGDGHADMLKAAGAKKIAIDHAELMQMLTHW